MPAGGSEPFPRMTEAADAPVLPRPRGRRDEVFAAGRVVSIDTNEFDEFNQCAAGWSVEHHVLGCDPCRSTVLLATTSSSFQVGLVQHTQGYSSQGANPTGTVSIATPVDEARPMVHRGHGIRPLELGVTRGGEGYECVSRFGTRFVIASVPQARVEAYACDLWQMPAAWRAPMDRLQFPDPFHRARYLDACERLLRIVREPSGLLADPLGARALEEAFLENLFLNAQAVPSRACGHARYDLARRSYAYLQDHVDEVPSIRQLCAVAHASYATLERGFRETYGMSPKSLMTAMRLSGARRTLLRPGPATHVTAVALRWGFVEFGRFSALYRQRYGEAPSQTLRRVRGAPPVDGP